jgi:hypothetical protein
MQTDMKLFYTPEELVRRYGDKVTVRTLANWRSAGISPPYCKIGGRILYRITDIEEWEKRRTSSSTAAYTK